MTKLLYMDNMQLLNCNATVVDVLQEQDKYIVILDQTAFYPQGGGQPYDQGTITGKNGTFIVEQVRFDNGIVKHIGTFESGNFKKNKTVSCVVDKERRKLHSRLHSAGHVIDLAINQLSLDWIPGKGFHFSEGSYVEYKGSLENRDKEVFKNELENLCNQFIQKSIPTRIQFVEKEEIKKLCDFVPDYIPEDKPSRVVLYGDFGVPCGGTHVENLSHIKKITIRKIKTKGKNIRVSYQVNDN